MDCKSIININNEKCQLKRDKKEGLTRPEKKEYDILTKMFKEEEKEYKALN